MKTDERKKLEEEMYNIANKIVGNVGPPIDSNFVFNRHTKDKPIVSSDTPCDIASFRLRRKIIDHSEIMNIWTKWVMAYMIRLFACNGRKAFEKVFSIMITSWREIKDFSSSLIYNDQIIRCSHKGTAKPPRLPQSA